MAEFTMPKNGEICWRELNSQNSAAAKEFYQELFGWQSEQSKVADVGYDEIHVDGKAVGGFMQINEQWGEDWQNIPAHWMTYVSVDNCDDTAEKVKENGGNVCVPPFDIPKVGRIAVINDPSGANFSIIQFVAH